jgi:hypothetical protein
VELAIVVPHQWASASTKISEYGELQPLDASSMVCCWSSSTIDLEFHLAYKITYVLDGIQEN